MRRRDFPVMMSGPTSAAASLADPIGDALRADVVAYWKMDEASEFWIDATGHGADLQKMMADGPSGTAGKVGQALLFNHAGDFNSSQVIGNGVGNPVTTAWPAGNNVPSPYLNLGDGAAFYIWGWVKGTPALTTWGSIFLHESSFGPGYSVGIDIIPDPNNGFEFFVGSNYTDTIPVADISAWSFVECYYTPAHQGIYLAINHGSFSGYEINDPTQVPVNSADCTFLGAAANGEFPANAVLDEWGIIKRASMPLSQDERDYLYNGGAGRSLY